MGFFTRIKHSSTSSSAASTPSNSGSTTPTTATPDPSSTILSSSPPPLTKAPSRLSLTKTLTWGKRSQEEKYRRRIASWEKEDQNEWAAPSARNYHKGRKLCKKDQDILRAFEWKVCRSSMEGGRSRSVFSGVSPGCSRMPSVDLERGEEEGLRRE
ncbi:uncharacterized protein RSE6_13016 [Rhynchosporium secalis]|uniref:Uncharacterized protein n=1 Tax=Rhynchosporium secalis TaxID=38038 RepID=A0A1E1MSP4_RHYSE|nr:uncharacterized protein RSE6_13016 [Rhynchosporium secalis]